MKTKRKKTKKQTIDQCGKKTESQHREQQKVVLEFTQTAWIKMRALVDSFSGEVQWHGTVERKEGEAFLITDILVFPHEASSATVISEQGEYEKWLNGLDDKTFNSCRFHGHSHVNMDVQPSCVDMQYRHNLIKGLGNPRDIDLFYIFLITNKKGDMSVEIYDLNKGVIYSTQETIIRVPLGGEDLASFIRHSKNLVTYSRPSDGFLHPLQRFLNPNYYGNYLLHDSLEDEDYIIDYQGGES